MRPEAQVEVVAAERPQPRGQTVHLLVPFEGGGAVPHGGPSHLRQALPELGDRPLEASGDPGEVLAVAVDQGGVRLAGEGVGEGEGRGVVVVVVAVVVRGVERCHAVQCRALTGALRQAP